MKESLRLSIEGMHCGACVRRVTLALQGAPGVQLGTVEVGSAQMAFDPRLNDAEAIAATVNGIGFQATIGK